MEEEKQEEQPEFYYLELEGFWDRWVAKVYRTGEVIFREDMKEYLTPEIKEKIMNNVEKMNFWQDNKEKGEENES